MPEEWYIMVNIMKCVRWMIGKFPNVGSGSCKYAKDVASYAIVIL